jgi:DnaJ-class molecular chaperone
MRLRGKGISRKGRGQGDLYVNLQVRLPEVTTEEERRALEILERAYGEHPRETGSRARPAA